MRAKVVLGRIIGTVMFESCGAYRSEVPEFGTGLANYKQTVKHKHCTPSFNSWIRIVLQNVNVLMHCKAKCKEVKEGEIEEDEVGEFESEEVQEVEFEEGDFEEVKEVEFEKVKEFKFEGRFEEFIVEFEELKYEKVKSKGGEFEEVKFEEGEFEVNFEVVT
ncbi:hypothetical protein ROHU_007446 [Labeo rohita]|uniref:Uncharacterized protein n=1 Tax=Labeo rohita TaxID=84645 RepID=A0A498MG86_LABRO|nr:hypothetical protein ROHU_007446 [Labeo rohita]